MRDQRKRPKAFGRRHGLTTRVIARLHAEHLRVNLEIRALLSRRPINGSGPVVTLTTHGDRYNRVHVVIESIAHGDLRPEKLILWLDDEVLFKAPSRGIRSLQRRGLDVRLSRNYGPHTKYFPYVLAESEPGEGPFVTADDDIVYPTDWLSRLAASSFKNPNDIICYRAHRITRTRDSEEIGPYGEWTEAEPGVSRKNFLTGVSGVLYPAAFRAVIGRGGEGFLAHCARADDVWLNVLALRNTISVRQLSPGPIHFPAMPRSRRGGLMVGNVEGAGNDAQIRAVYSRADWGLIFSDNG